MNKRYVITVMKPMRLWIEAPDEYMARKAAIAYALEIPTLSRVHNDISYYRTPEVTDISTFEQFFHNKPPIW